MLIIAIHLLLPLDIVESEAHDLVPSSGGHLGRDVGWVVLGTELTDLQVTYIGVYFLPGHHSPLLRSH